MFRFSKPETPREALFVFLGNETRAKSGFVSYVSISLCFDFDPTPGESVSALLSVGADIWFSPRAESGDELRPFVHNHKVVSANAHLCPPGKSS